MKIPLNVVSIFVAVAIAALVGMVLGAAFGLAAGSIAPDLFVHFIPWEELEPVGVAVVMGAAAGVFCGGGLGVFAVLVQGLADWLSSRRSGADREG